MGKAKGVSKRRRKVGSFHYKRKNKLKRQRLRELRKCGPINCDAVREAWNSKKSLKDNMKNMGLSENPNALLNGPKFHEQFKNPDLDKDPKDNLVLRLHQKLEKKKKRSLARKLKKSKEFDVEIETKGDDDNNNDDGKRKVSDILMEEASKPTHKNFRFGPDQIKFCAYMLEKYGEDYEAMSRDKINYYQESPGQIRAKIKKFLSIPSNRDVYEKAKQICENQLDLG